LGNLKIWHWPNEECEYDEYTIGVDPSGGDPSGNSCVVCVYSRALREQAAEWHGIASPHELGQISAQIGRFYSSGLKEYPALLGIECNNHGHAVLETNAIQDYPNIYFREHIDAIAKIRTKKIGWETNSKTKWLMIDGLAADLRTGQLKINSKEAIEECLMFHRHQIEKLGRSVEESLALAQGTQKRYTDRVIALAIAMRMENSLPPFREFHPEPQVEGWRKSQTELDESSFLTYYPQGWMLA